jgi:hypothetical protein
MKIFRNGDLVIVEGKRHPGVVINTRGSKVSVRTDDDRSLVNIDSDKVDLLKILKKFEKVFT